MINTGYNGVNEATASKPIKLKETFYKNTRGQLITFAQRGSAKWFSMYCYDSKGRDSKSLAIKLYDALEAEGMEPFIDYNLTEVRDTTSDKVIKVIKKLGFTIEESANESVSEINEALKPAKYGYQGSKDAKLPSGNPELSASNSLISVFVTTNDQDDIAVCVDFDEKYWDESEGHLEKFFKSKDEKAAIKFGEKMLKEINSKLIDPERVGKEYDFDIIGL